MIILKAIIITITSIGALAMLAAGVLLASSYWNEYKDDRE